MVNLHQNINFNFNDIHVHTQRQLITLLRTITDLVFQNIVSN